MDKQTEIIASPHGGRRTLLSGAIAALAFTAGRSWGMAGLAAAAPAAAFVPPAFPRRVSEPVPVMADSRSEWEVFKRRFIAADGRVIDTGNGGVSHSEGQGWGMLFAASFDDRATFDLLHGWTRGHLQRGGDHLHAWRYQPNAPVQVPDSNNATDGDLWIAAALGRAAMRWNRPELAAQAKLIAQDILAMLVREAGPRLVLLPGADGFTHAEGLTVNPSYYAFPALEELAALAPSPVWARVIADGRALLDEARFGHWQLPADWLLVDRQTGAVSPHPNWPARFSYDAIRVPLWLAWSDQQHGVVSQSFAHYWTSYQTNPPAWVDLKTNAPASYPAPSGMLAIGRIATALSQREIKQPLLIGFPELHTSPDYYSAALIMLSRCAWQECRTMV
jgi:endoglucanase